MSTLELFVLSTALGADLFSVAVPIGMNRVRWRLILSSSVVFAVFHIVLILTGYFGGHWLGAFLDHVGTYHIDCPAAVMQDWAGAAGGLILAALGLHMIRENLAGVQPNMSAHHPLKGMMLMVLAFSVSVDALVAGFSLGMMDVDMVKLCIILGWVIFAIAVAGLSLGRRLGWLIGRRSELIGGLVLIMLGIHIFWTSVN